jgi:FkbM family methyltransferase
MKSKMRLAKQLLHRLVRKFRIDKILYHSIYLLWRFLPSKQQRALRDNLLLAPARLDYKRHDILLANHIRVGSCAKEPDTVQWIEENLKPGDVLYDIGANIGAYSLVASKYCGDSIEVYAFEPSVFNYYELSQNIILNKCQESIKPYMIALSDKTGSSVLNYRSLAHGRAGHALGPAVDYKEEPFLPIYQQHVMSFSIDDLIEHFDFPVPNYIKLDVDGIELEILYGAARTLESQAVKSLLVEVYRPGEKANKLEEWLTQKGFMISSRQDYKATSNYIYKRRI